MNLADRRFGRRDLRLGSISTRLAIRLGRLPQDHLVELAPRFGGETDGALERALDRYGEVVALMLERAEQARGNEEVARRRAVP